MLKGECDKLVEGEPIHLKEGNVLMMDIGCHHSISTLHQNDLMINLIFNNKNISFKFWDETHKKDSFIYQYILTFLCKIIISRSSSSSLKTLILLTRWTRFINEYFSGYKYRGMIIDNYFNILLAKIIRNYPMIKKRTYDNQQKNIS